MLLTLWRNNKNEKDIFTQEKDFHACSAKATDHSYLPLIDRNRVEKLFPQSAVTQQHKQTHTAHHVHVELQSLDGTHWELIHWNIRATETLKAFWYYVFKKKLKKRKKPQQGMRGLVHGGCRKLYVTEWWKHLNVLGARQSHLGSLAHTAHMFLSSWGLYALSACYLWSFCCFEHANVQATTSIKTDRWKRFSPVKVAVFIFCVPHMCAEKTKHPNTSKSIVCTNETPPVQSFTQVNQGKTLSEYHLHFNENLSGYRSLNLTYSFQNHLQNGKHYL